MFKPEGIVGCDVQKSALEEAERNGVRAAFHRVEVWPPSSVRDESVDYICSFSVFSHLSEDNPFAWIREFQRVLRPGGLAFLTTRPRGFFDYLDSLHKRSDVPGFAQGAALAFRDLEQARKEYDLGRFCFDPMGSGGKGLTAVYGEAFIPPEYVRNKYGPLFSSVGMDDPISKGLLNQATIWLQK